MKSSNRSLAFAALVALAVTPLAGQSAKKTYKTPRTAWGDPDLQGVWPSTDMVGTPLQRAAIKAAPATQTRITWHILSSGSPGYDD